MVETLIAKLVIKLGFDHSTILNFKLDLGTLKKILAVENFKKIFPFKCLSTGSMINQEQE